MFGSVAGRLRSSQITVGNLEGTLGCGGPSKCGGGRRNCFAFQAPSSYAGVFARAGFDVMNLANNHALDFGPSGQRQTIAALGRHGIAHTGRPGEIRLRRVGGTRVALVGFAPYPRAASLLDPAAAMRLVRRARRRAEWWWCSCTPAPRARTAFTPPEHGVRVRGEPGPAASVRTRRGARGRGPRPGLGTTRGAWHRALPRAT